MWNRRQFSLAIGAVALAGSGAALYASDEQKLQEAARDLERVGLFAFGGIGLAGRTSSGELDFRIVMAETLERKLVLLENTYAKGTPEGIGYALTGIFRLKLSRFEERYRSVRNSSAKVRTMQGCIADTTTLGALARDISEGKYKISANGILEP